MTRVQRLETKFKSARYRHAYVGAHARRGIAHQVRVMRQDRGWSQGDLAKKMGKPQSVVSRIEDPAYGRLTMATLLGVAQAFDVALSVRFVSFAKFVRDTDDISPRALNAPSYY